MRAPSDGGDASAVVDAVVTPDVTASPGASSARPGTLYQVCGANGTPIDLLVISLTASPGTTIMCPDANHDIPLESLQFIFDPPAAGVGTVPAPLGGYFGMCTDAGGCVNRGRGSVTFEQFDPTAATR